MSSSKEFTFTWVIENFKLYPQKNGECINSPNFLLNHFDNTEWYLQFYPRGNKLSSAHFVSCYLCRSNDGSPQDIEINFKLSSDGVRLKSVHCFKKNSRWGWTNFTRRSCVEKLHVYSIECHMRLSSTLISSPYLELDLTESQNHYLAHSVWKSPFVVPEVPKETCLAPRRKVGETLKDLLLYSNQAFARSFLSVERKVYNYVIPDFLRPESKHRQYIYVELHSATLVIMLFMNKKDNNDLLEIEICFEDKRESNCVLICKLELLGSERQIFFSAEKEHLFESDKDNEKWNIGHPFMWCKLKERKEAYLRFTLTFSDGQCFSDIEKTTGVDDCIGLLNLPNDISINLLRMFTEKKFCDVTIRVQDKSINAHKTVLCCRSSVFAAMFNSGMIENGTNNIEIDDLDFDTVYQMLYFMYSGSIEELKGKSFVRLFVASDKYEIIPLKNICRNILKNNLTTQNICSILLLADTYQDDELSKSAVVYISHHKNDVLKSEEWKEFKKSNVCLALETLTKVCMKLFP